MGILLTVFLTQKQGEVVLVNPSGATHRESFFTNKAYMVATGLVPPVINFYYHRSKPNLSCLDHSTVALADGLWTRHSESEDSLASAVRGFPVVIIFHTIATACCWFIEMQQAQQNRNVKMIENLKRELADARAEHASKKKS